MPESLNAEDLNRLRRLAPSDPYQRHMYNYSLFMGDAAQQRGGFENQWMARSQSPRLRMQGNEAVSPTYPYVFAKGSEWDAPPGWDEGFLGYYGMSGADSKGAYINRANKQINVPARMVRTPFQISNRRWPHVPVAQKVQRPAGATTAYLTLG